MLNNQEETSEIKGLMWSTDVHSHHLESQHPIKALIFLLQELSEPCIALFEKMGFQGKKIEFSTEILNLQFLGYNPRIASVQVLGGM